MAVSHKTNNLINCNRCHLPFNLKNTVPKMLTCKHWYCFNCLEYYLYTAKDTEKYIECIHCQRSIENMQGVYNHDQLNMHTNNNIYCKQFNQNNNNNNNNNKSDNNSSSTTTSYGCEDELFIQLDYELLINNGGNKSRSASLASEENSIGSFTYFNTNNSNHIANSTTNGSDLEGSIHFGNRGISSAVTEKMLPGENCFIHGMPNTLWCQTCLAVLCRGCNAGLEHKDHKVENQLEAKEFYQNRVKQEFMQIQMSVEEMENLQALQKNFLLKLLDTCCNLKLQIEHELLANSKATEVDDMKDTMKNLQLCFGLLGKQTPNEILKLYKIIKDENTKLKMKHKLLLQQYKMQQLLSKSQRILDFDIIKEFCQKLDSSENFLKQNEETENGENNSLMMLTNYCIYRVYMKYMRQQQQFIEEQVLRYQQYHQEQKQQNLLKQYKMLQQHNLSTLSLQNQNKNQQHQHQHHQDSQIGNNEFNNSFYNLDKENKPKTYAEIATSQNAHQFDLNDNTTTNGFAVLPTSTNNFQPYRKPLNKTYEEPRKTVQLLFNPINNENNQIYFFDFERNGLLLGRVLIKVFADIAPKMSYNFHALATHEKGFGYIGCKVFECHPNESIITGDIEQNTGYSSRSIYEDVQFVPDDTNIAPFAGAVGMRRAKKKFHSQGLVGSQFRIILTELGFTAIFGCVIEGIDVIKKISQTLVQNDKIHGNSQQNTTTGTVNNSVNGVGQICSNGTVAGIFIAQCGLYEFVKRDIMCGI